MAGESQETVAATPEQLAALCDEMAALVRAGLPLDTGLADGATELPRLTGRGLRLVADRLARGEPLEAAVTSIGGPLAPLLRTVVAAGQRAGRLPAALEQLADLALLQAELKRISVYAWIYPLVVLVAAALVMALFAVGVLNPIREGFYELRASGTRGTSFLLGLAQWPAWFWPLAALVFAIAAAVVTRWLLRPARTRGADTAWRPFGRLIVDAETAGFAGLLGLLVEQRVPLADALRLSGESTQGETGRAARALADSVERGEPLAKAASASRLPAALRFALVAANGPALANALAQVSETYRDRARWRANRLRTTLPVTLVLVVGGTATLACGLTLFYPWATLLRQLGSAVSQ